MEHNYTPYEKEIFRQVLFSLSLELRPFKHPDKDLDLLLGIIERKMELLIEKFDVYKTERIFRALDRVTPKTRGKEECDCHKGEHMCGCRVEDFNDCVEQTEYAIKLLKDKIYDNEV